MDEPEEEDTQLPPRIRLVRGRPWTITESRREKWSGDAFLERNAVPIRQLGDPILAMTARKPTLPRPQIEALVAKMFASMIAARGIGIAAPQVGVPLRVAILDVDRAGIVIVNPKVTWRSEQVTEVDEACLSVRGAHGIVTRPIGAGLEAVDIAGKRFEVAADGTGAQCLLHETDHLDGLLYLHKVESPDLLFLMDEEGNERSYSEIRSASPRRSLTSL